MTKRQIEEEQAEKKIDWNDKPIDKMISVIRAYTSTYIERYSIRNSITFFPRYIHVLSIYFRFFLIISELRAAYKPFKKRWRRHGYQWTQTTIKK